MSANLAGLRTLNLSDDDEDKNAFDDSGEDVGYEKYFGNKTRTPGLSPSVLSQGLVALHEGLRDNRRGQLI